MNALDLLAHLRHRSAGTRPDDHLTAPTHTADPDRCDEITPPAPKPPGRSPARAELDPGQLAAIEAATIRQPIDRTPATTGMLADLQNAMQMLAEHREPSPPPVGQAWPSPRTWATAELTEREVFREKRVLAELADLTRDLGPLAAAQTKFAPHLRKDHHG